MGKKSGSSGPAAPDPAAAARAQGAANKEAVYESARVNQINEVNPWGSLTYSGDIGSPDRTRTTSLSPEGQQAFDTQQEITQGLGTYAKDKLSELPTTPFSLGQFGDVPMVDKDYRTDYENARFERLAPQWEKDRAALETQLANSGITQGSDAYNDAIDEMNRTKTDARLAIQGAGTSEMGNLLSMALQSRQQGIGEYQLERNAPINELSAALQGAPAVGTPNFAQPAQYSVASPDIAGLTMGTYGAQANAAAQQNAGANALAGNVLGSGATLGAAYMLSDIRLKDDIYTVGKLSNGLNVYSYRYLWSDVPQIGVMAHEVLNVIPEAVQKVGAYLAVDYSMLEAA